ncbi:NADase-type glycan-binding domain-containing protein [Nocardia salmonicida]|uniref:NADase-type glycan-binding domain-containing protein n=1 Tax=Nocardia salmonicida TaxID=53431 RepID=UPI003CFB5DF1
MGRKISEPDLDNLRLSSSPRSVAHYGAHADNGGRWIKSGLNIFSLLVAAVVGALGIKIADNLPELWTTVSSAWQGPSCENTKNLKLVHGEISGTSFLPETATPSGTYRFDPARVADEDPGTAWVEGVDGFGEGQKLTITLPETYDVRFLCIVNGYPLEPKLFQRNGRVRTVDVRTDQGNLSGSTLNDPPGDDLLESQQLNIPAGPTTMIELTIKKVYPSLGQDRFEDTAVAEVAVYAAD